MARKRNSGASAGATAPAPSGASVFIHSKICLSGEITLRPGVNVFATEQLMCSDKAGRQLEKLARAGLIRIDLTPPPAPPPPVPPPPAPPPPELATKTPAELEALLREAKTADEANAITAALAASDKDPGLGGPKLPAPPAVPPVPPAAPAAPAAPVPPPPATPATP